MRACPGPRPKGVCARCLSGFPTSGFGRRLCAVAAVKVEVELQEATRNDGTGRRVGLGLALGIFLFPVVFVWLLLRRGHSPGARIAGFSWLAVATTGLLLNALVSNSPAEPVVEAGVQQPAASQPTTAPVRPWREKDGGLAISRAEFEAQGMVWPLTVEEAIVGCYPPGLMWVKANRRRYALTGAGKANYMYKPIEEIWIENTGQALADNPGQPRVPIRDVFELSKSLC